MKQRFASRVESIFRAQMVLLHTARFLNFRFGEKLWLIFRCLVRAILISSAGTWAFESAISKYDRKQLTPARLHGISAAADY